MYGSFLSRVPIHLNQDELGFSLNAYSISKTGYDENGRFLPFYFWHLGVMWATPIIVYLTAIVLTFLPLSESAIRAPSVFIGLLNIVLIWFFVREFLKSEKWATLAAFLMTTTPVHFIQSRILLDNLYPVPFVTGWLLCVWLYLKNKKVSVLFLGMFLLGIGLHSYHATKIMMLVYFVMTIVFVWKDIKKNKKLLVWSCIAFFLPLLPFVWWLQKYPDTLVDQVKYTGIYDSKLPPALGFLTLLSPGSLLHRLDVYVNYFNPRFLFLTGDQSLIHSTHRSGVFLLPFFAFLPMGLYQICKKRTKNNWLILMGFFTAPLAATVAGDHYRISRALFILPFAILAATVGVQYLWSGRRLGGRIICIFLLFLIPLQFGYFYYDYMTKYRIRSYSWFNNNIPGALENAISYAKSNDLDAIYLDHRVDFIERYWKFYTIKNNTPELVEKVVYSDPYSLVLDTMPKKSAIIYNFNHVNGQKKVIGPFHKVKDIIEPDGVSTFYLYAN